MYKNPTNKFIIFVSLNRGKSLLKNITKSFLVSRDDIIQRVDIFLANDR